MDSVIDSIDLDKYHVALDASDPIRVNGKVTKVVGLTIEAYSPTCRLGSLCEIYPKGDVSAVRSEAVGFRESKVLLMPLGEIRGIGPGSRVSTRQQNALIGVGKGLLGRVIDGLGNPIDGKGPLRVETEYPIYKDPTNPLLRKRIAQPLDTGIRAVNGLLTIGCGQRVGIFSGSGVGKSVLLGMIARKTTADVNVIALIGERGREVNDFLEKELGQEGLKRSVVVVATSDHPPLIRMRGAFIATAVAEYFRDQGRQVILMMDSVTRFAMAQREVGLATGEPPTTKGYTPSVFALLPKLLERAWTSSNHGTITGLYTVLVEADDMNEPISDAVRAILDGHIILSRELANQNHYPAIDILGSVSRLMNDITDPQHREKANRVKAVMSTYKKTEDLINIGAYVKGSSPKIDYAIEMIGKINAYLEQDVPESCSLKDSIRQLGDLFR
jgi:flagellum-specific ATP synthase